jgi:hypothetical protein
MGFEMRPQRGHQSIFPSLLFIINAFFGLENDALGDPAVLWLC